MAAVSSLAWSTASTKTQYSFSSAKVTHQHLRNYHNNIMLQNNATMKKPIYGCPTRRPSNVLNSFDYQNVFVISMNMFQSTRLSVYLNCCTLRHKVVHPHMIRHDHYVRAFITKRSNDTYCNKSFKDLVDMCKKKYQHTKLLLRDVVSSSNDSNVATTVLVRSMLSILLAGTLLSINIELDSIDFTDSIPLAQIIATLNLHRLPISSSTPELCCESSETILDSNPIRLAATPTYYNKPTPSMLLGWESDEHDENGAAINPRRVQLPKDETGAVDVCKTYDVSVKALKGGRLSMEDEYIISHGGRFAAVFDGHGGGGVSSFLRETLFTNIAKHLLIWTHIEQNFDHMASNGSDISLHNSFDGKGSTVHLQCPSIESTVRAIRAAFLETDKQILQIDKFHYQGSTATTVLLHEDIQSGNRTIVAANVGDSRVVLSHAGEAVDLSWDHKPSHAVEKERILAMGGTIEWDHYCQVHRVLNLSLSRSMGDRFAKPIVSSTVDIKVQPVDDQDEFIILASDGLWDVFSSQDCVNFIRKRYTIALSSTDKATVELKNKSLAARKNMSRLVAYEAIRRGSGDNICILIIWLKDLD